ncbi:MAG: helix-turn-helix domain-containing protein [Oscillospiraceae bacterium]|nr:helix-turn-helix domain-containing protein [Oscillospiraceae bacterium]
MSSRIFQSVIIQMKDATTRAIGVVDPEGIVVASSDLSLIGTNVGVVQTQGGEHGGDLTTTYGGRTYKALGVGAADDYTVFAEGEDELSKTICIMASIAISEAGIYFEENHDKRAFVKNIVTENVLPGDIYIRAKELRFASEVMRGVLVIRNSTTIDPSAIDLLQDSFPDRHHDFVISVGDNDIAVIKEMPPTADLKFLLKFAEMIEQKLESELSLKTVIGIGTPARHLRELPDRYKEALISIDVGRVFDAEKNIISYESLGIGRLIYQLPTTLCEIFLSEVFKRNPIEALDQETLFTIDKFFENSLNVSETSRKLFVHRNTLVYRLEKIKKITGLDLREFDHAIIFKVALMVKKYLVSQESKY